MMIVALAVTTEGLKVPLGLWEGSSQNATVVWYRLNLGELPDVARPTRSDMEKYEAALFETGERFGSSGS